MDRNEMASQFYMDDHAVLYALLVKHAVLECAKAGEAAAQKATVVYGRERGVRMAMRCLADGNPLAADNYMIYGEWQDDRGWSTFRVGGYAPYELEAIDCGWNNAWRKYDLLDYGKMYCQLIDVELVRGFNPRNTLDVQGTLSQGAEKCRFLFGGMSVASDADNTRAGELRRQKIPGVIKDFLFHAGHVLSAFRRTYLLELGLVDADAILEKAGAGYAEIFGQEKLRAVEAESRLDFSTI